MNLYVLTQGAKPQRDMAAGFVVAAKDEDQARELAANQAGDEGPWIWEDGERSECHLIGHSAVTGQEATVLMRDFFSG
jgi:hypothetical protein